MQIRWSPAAAEDLQQIFDHIRADNPDAAQRVAKTIYDRAGGLDVRVEIFLRVRAFDDFLKEEGIFEHAQAQAVKEVVAWRPGEAMRKQKISKNKMATLLKTSRTQG